MRTHQKRRDGYREILPARSDTRRSQFPYIHLKNQTQPQRKHNSIVDFRNGAAKTSTDNNIVYK